MSSTSVAPNASVKTTQGNAPTETAGNFTGPITLTVAEAKRLRQIALQLQQACKLDWLKFRRNRAAYLEFMHDVERLANEAYGIVAEATWTELEAEYAEAAYLEFMHDVERLAAEYAEAERT